VKQKLFIFIFFFLFSASPFCAAENTKRIIFIQDIYVQWIEMEQQLNIDNIDVLYKSIQSYLDSESYRIYRFIPFSTAFGFGHTDPNEMYEVTAVSELLQSLRYSVLNGEHEEVREISNAISGNLIKALAWDSLTEQFTTDAYIRLFLLLFSIIVIAVFVIVFLSRELTGSLRREEEGSIYSRAVLLAQEGERSRLSRELHDTIAQDLRYLSLEMGKISKTTEHTEREKLCTDAAQMQAGLIGKVRDICDYLVPPDFRFQGLPDALRRLCLDFGKRTGIDCRIDITGKIKQNFLDEEKQLQIFRIAQEALTNVEKHAQATEAIVMLRCDASGALYLGISDDGKGFNVFEKKNAKYDGIIHLGVRGMNERAALLGGNLIINSEPGEGTLVRFQMESNNECAVN